MKCLGCKKEHEDVNWIFKNKGWYCTKYHLPSKIDIVPSDMKDEREKHFNAVIQPYRSGELSREYIEAHGTKGIDVTKQQAKKAKHTWKDLRGWHNRAYTSF